VDYSKARPREERLNHPLVQTALATGNHFRKAGTAEIVAQDVGSTDANMAVAMGIPAVAIGAVEEFLPHRLEEYANAESILPGVKRLVALAVALGR
jgi:tripeptide aminopeptidase